MPYFEPFQNGVWNKQKKSCWFATSLLLWYQLAVDFCLFWIRWTHLNESSFSQCLVLSRSKMVVDLGKGYLVGTAAFIPYLMFVGNIFLFHWLNLKMRCHFLNDLFQMSCSKEVGDAKDLKHSRRYMAARMGSPHTYVRCGCADEYSTYMCAYE